MPFRSFIITLIGIAIAAGSVFFAREYALDTRGAAIASVEPELVDVIVARTDIAFGQKVERQLLTTQAWPRASVPAGAILLFDEILPGAGEDARSAKAHVYQGEILLAQKLSGFGQKVTIVQKLGKNTRAMAIKVTAVTAVGGFVTPGDRVDIVMTVGGKDGLQAVTILQNIRVIGVDQQAAETADQPEVARTITVEVTPSESQRLALAQRAGSLSLTLRTLDGVLDEKLDMVQMRDLLQDQSPVEEEKASNSVKVRRGTETTIVDLD